MSTDAPASDRTRLRRIPENGRYDRGTVDAILDAALVAHVGFVHDGQPFVIPTLHARVGDEVFLHGSSASRTLRELGTGTPLSVTVTLLDGIVLARSIFEHSVNYRSVVVLGRARLIDEREEKLAALRALSDQLLPGRWDDVRPPTDQELKATTILSVPLDEASAKVSEGPPDDGETPDAELDVWAGEIPLVVRALDPLPDPFLKDGIAVPPYAARYRRPGFVGD
ncbi:MAG TPA: pyridoxamine 5'-phosphate oxidase family protein [Actinomycetota bacterium]|nr:pyridoxamine 5'-phosphate oxidase family protein [Actinomycetota bacterium]